MALGNSQIGNVVIEQDVIKNRNEKMLVSLNTFQYVVKNLREWADETTLGSNAINNLQQLNEYIEKTISSMKKLDGVIDNFISEQKRNNG